MTLQRFLSSLLLASFIGTATASAQPPALAPTTPVPITATPATPPAKGPTRAALNAHHKAPPPKSPGVRALEGAFLGGLIVAPVAALATLFSNADFDCEVDCGFDPSALLIVEGLGVTLGALVGYRLASSDSEHENKPRVAPRVSATADGKGATVGVSGRF